MTRRVVRTPLDVDTLAVLLKASALPVTVSIAKGDRRSLDQNDLQFKWLSEAAMQLGHDVEDLRCECKLILGIPILRAEDESFRAMYDECLKPLDYVRKLRLMRHWPITRLMTTRQLSAYLDAMYRRFADQGVALTIPEDRK